MTPANGAEHDEHDSGKIWYVDVMQDVVNRDLSAILSRTQRIPSPAEFAPDVVHYHPSGLELLAFNLVRSRSRCRS